MMTEALQEELASLRHSVQELKERLAERDEALRLRDELLQEAWRAQRRLEELVANVPGMVWEAWGEPDENRPDFMSEYVLSMTGYTSGEWLATPGAWLVATHPEDKERAQRETGAIFMSGGSGLLELRWLHKDGRTLWTQAQVSAIVDDSGKPVGLRGVTLDITARRQAEEERACIREQLIQAQAEEERARIREQLVEAQAAVRAEEERARMREQLIQAQTATLTELSIPLIPIDDRVVVVPLIGRMDAARAERMIEVLLHGMSGSSAEVAIIDITGVASMDRDVADMLMRAANAVRLLGAEAILTGIQPSVARTLIDLGVDLRGIVTRGTLQSGIDHATSRSRSTRPR